MPSGDGFAVEAYVTFAPVTRSGDGFSVEAFVYATANISARAVIGSDALIAPQTEAPRAGMGVDLNLTNASTPANLKVWNGSEWVLIEMYYYDNATMSWKPVT